MEFEDVDGGVQIRCDAPDSECVHLLSPDKYQVFLQAICQPWAPSVIDGVRLAVKKNKRPLEFDAAHELAEVKFTWYDWDSPFYGDKGVEVEVGPRVDPPKRLFFSMMSDFEKLSAADKDRFVHDIALKFFPEKNGREN